MNHGENVNITLVTYPEKDKGKFPNKIDIIYKNYKKSYNDYKKPLEKLSKNKFEEHLFSPLKYHLFSNYDLAVISITDSEKFAQKVFAPDSKDEQTNRSTYQIITGITKQTYENSNFNLSTTLKDLTINDWNKNKPREGKYKYALFINLCVNKGLLIGIGVKLIDQLCKIIDQKIRKRLNINLNTDCVINRYLVSKSYSWFDLSITIFGDQPQELINSLLDIRNIKLGEVIDVCSDIKCEDSLYKTLYKNEIDETKIRDFHVITETNSILGVEYYKFKRGGEYATDELNTQVEWKVKSGYEREFCEMIKTLEKKEFCNHDEFYFTNGRMDFIFEEKKKNLIESNLTVFKELRTNRNISQYIKKVKTRTLFNNAGWHKEIKGSKLKNKKGQITDITEKLEKLTFLKKEICEIKIKLRKDKISRQLRNKIIKCYYLTNIGLTDRVLFNFYLDFIPFLKRLKFFILDEKLNSIALKDYENILIEYIIAYDRAYKNRTFNSYLFEDIHEYSIDYNASLQQLLSNYNTCAHILTRGYNENKKDHYQSNPRFLVNINLNNTVSNQVYINFHVHDLTAPELIFCLLHKEIINEYIKLGLIESPITLPLNYKEDYSFLDTNDIFNDCFRMILTFNFDFGLYSFWFWSFNIQNTQLYDQNGFMNEAHFAHELIRFLTVKIIFDNQDIDKCPIPELFVYWDRYYVVFDKELREVYPIEKVEFYQDKIIASLELFINNSEIFNDTSVFFKGKWLKTLATNKPGFKENNLWYFRYRWLTLSHEYSQNTNLFELYKEIKSYEKFDTYSERQKHTFILDTLIYCFLKKMKQEQDGEISILRRNLLTGEPLNSFIKILEYKSFYCLDPQGGHFNVDSNRNMAYYELRNQMMEIIWDITLMWKKDYINERINN